MWILFVFIEIDFIEGFIDEAYERFDYVLESILHVNSVELTQHLLLRVSQFENEFLLDNRFIYFLIGFRTALGGDLR